MNSIQKSETIKNGLRKGFQDGSSKIAKRRCYFEEKICANHYQNEETQKCSIRELRVLRYFLLAAREENITKAADLFPRRRQIFSHIQKCAECMAGDKI